MGRQPPIPEYRDPSLETVIGSPRPIQTPLHRRLHVGPYLLHQQLVGGVGAAGAVGATGVAGALGARGATQAVRATGQWEL